MAKSPAWQRRGARSEKGGLNAKGRASYNAANPGKPGLKAPQPEGGPRKKSFCSRMEGMKKKLTSSKPRTIRTVVLTNHYELGSVEMTEHHNAAKQIIDAVSVATVVATLMEVLPPIAALFTIIWTGIQIYETDTVQRLLGRESNADNQ